MSAYLNRTTKEYVRGIDPTGMEAKTGEVFKGVDGQAIPNANWARNPDMSAVAGEPSKYWIITGDDVTLMDQAARDAVDAAAETAQLDSIADELDQTRTIMRAFAEVVLDQVNALRADHGRNALTHAQLKAAVRGKL